MSSSESFVDGVEIGGEVVAHGLKLRAARKEVNAIAAAGCTKYSNPAIIPIVKSQRK